MVPFEVLPSPQLMVAEKLPVGSTALAWVKVATWKFVSVWLDVVMGAETVIAGSANDVLADALLFDVLASWVVAVTEAVSLLLPSSVAWPLTVAVTVAPEAMLPIVKVTVPPELVNVPWLVLAER